MALHQDQPVLTFGEPLAGARAAMIMLHGRGATARDILSLASSFDAPGVAFLAPQAANNTWYPHPFTAPLDRNEPWLSSALARVDQLVQHAADAGIPAAQTHLLGFSQGACLTLEYAARHARRYGGIFGLSGGLIGPAGTPRDYGGGMDGSPVFLGCSDVDSHVPKWRVEESAAVLRAMGADVDLQLYPGMGHLVSDDEIARGRAVLRRAMA